MTVTLELRPEEVAALNNRAKQRGTTLETALHEIISHYTPAAPQAELDVTTNSKATIALMQAWLAEKAGLTSEELTANDQEFEDFKTNINRWRAEEGRAPAFP